MSPLAQGKRRPSRHLGTVQKPRGVLHPRVQKVGPQHFGVVCFDCHKAASKWMLADFYGKILIEPTRVRHTGPELEAAVALVRHTAEAHSLKDLVVAIERTGTYHLPVKRCFDRFGFDTRIVHPFATKHYRLPAEAGIKTDDADLHAIFQATIAGYGLIEQELDETYRTLRLLTRHRRDLVEKRSSLCCQIREHLEAVLPGYGALFDDLWESNIALSLAEEVGSVGAVPRPGPEGALRSSASARTTLPSPDRRTDRRLGSLRRLGRSTKRGSSADLAGAGGRSAGKNAAKSALWSEIWPRCSSRPRTSCCSPIPE